MANGVIAVPCAEQARWSAFYGALAGLDRPEGTEIVQVRGCSPAENRNAAVERALELGASWIFWLDDDLVFRPDTLTRLLRHDVDIVAGLSLRRQPPFPPLWWVGMEGTKVCFANDLTPGPNGLVPIQGCTSGGMLTKTRIFTSTAAPWWTIGQYEPDEWHDDVWFCDLMRAAGYDLWGDPSVRLGHLTGLELWPHEQGGQWYRMLARSRTIAIVWPMDDLVRSTGETSPAGSTSPTVTARA